MVPLHEVKLEGSRDVEKLHFPVPIQSRDEVTLHKIYTHGRGNKQGHQASG